MDKRILPVALGLFLGLMSCAPGYSGRPGPNCTVGKPCGQTCISKDKTCHVKKQEMDTEMLAEGIVATGDL